MAIQFLGYNNSPEGIQLHVGKVEAVQSWPFSTTIKELQCFLGFANFYHRFIQNYSSITAPITSLLKSNPKSLFWTPEATHAYQQLKQAQTSVQFGSSQIQTSKVEVDTSTSAVLPQHQGKPPTLHPYAILHKLAFPGGAELQHRQPRTSCHQACVGGVVALAGEGPSYFLGVNESP